VFVVHAARALLEKKLASSRFGTDEFLDLMMEDFEKKESRIILSIHLE
jgi:hypothetical protein